MDRFWRRRLGPDGGFTLIEMVAAMAVFSIAAAALVAVLAAGIRTAGVARDRTLAKDLAREKLEEMRRLPFYRDYATFRRKVDVLDFYLPDLGAGYSAAMATYTTTTSGSVGAFRYTMTVEARFVNPARQPITPCGDVDLTKPCSGYLWNSETLDKPPSRLLETTVTVFWGTATRRSFTLRSLLGEPRLSAVVIQGSADGTLIQIDTAFSDGSILLGKVGVASSAIFVGEGSTARNDTLAAQVSVTQDTGTVTSVAGARQAVTAPPDTSVSQVDAAAVAMAHPSPLITGIGLVCNGGTLSNCVADLGPSRVKDLAARVQSGPPKADGTLVLAHSGNDTDAGGPRGLGVTNQVDGADGRALNAARPFVSIPKIGARAAELKSRCEQEADSVVCRVAGPDSGSPIPELRMIPVTFSNMPSASRGFLFHVHLDSLTVEARTNRLTPGSAVATATATGSVHYYSSVDGVSWTETSVPIGSAFPAELTAIPVGPGRSYADYIVSWSAIPQVSSSKSADGREVQAVLGSAVRIVTRPTNKIPSFETSTSGFIVSVGAAQAQAVDRR